MPRSKDEKIPDLITNTILFGKFRSAAHYISDLKLQK
jgi:hypothetical protein